MKIILAPDSFKGSLTSMEVAEAMERGIKRVLPGADCIKIPWPMVGRERYSPCLMRSVGI